MNPVAKYTLLRLALFVAALVVLDLLGANGVLLLLLAAVVSLALSYVLLAGPREEVARRLADRTAERLARRREGGGLSGDDEAVEDAADEASRRRGAQDSNAQDTSQD